MHPKTLTISTPAKINFGLSIGPKRKDGYHPISTLFIPITLYDTIELTVTSEPGITLSCFNPDVPNNSSNLCWKAAKLLLDQSEQLSGIHINLGKKIPVGAGLGGGSSDAAAVIKGLSQLIPGQFTQYQLTELAVKLGADIPFFLKNTPCSATGIGEILAPMMFPWKCKILLVIPPFLISTADAYNALDKGRTDQSSLIDYAQELRSLQNLNDAQNTFCNDFETILCSHYPELSIIKNSLLELDANYAALTGSGSAIYGMFTKAHAAQEAAKKLSTSYRTELVSPLV